MLADQFICGSVAEQFDECGIYVENLAGGIAAAHAVGGVGHERAEIQFGMAQVFLSGA